MSEFRQDLQSFKPSPSFTEVAANMEMMNQIIELNPSMLENFNFSVETFFPHHQQEFPENFFRSLNSEPVSHATNSPEDVFQENKKRKKRLEKGKEGRSKSEEVVHVRARRGQATDSHSLAERVRREKINDKMKCLQNLVPGCHKTMGMAGMLDEIINYVHSLQNQVEFLSMELAAASSNDFKLEGVATEKLQGINSQEAEETQQWAREPYGDHTCFQCS